MNDQVDFKSLALQICKTNALELDHKVGEGSYKETYRVKNSEGEILALKIFKSGDISVRSQREIESMIRCDHPCIAKILQIDTYNFQGNSFLYLLEEFFGGGTLQAKLEKTGIIPIDEIFFLGTKLIEAIRHIASLSLVHRDIKPDNILFRDNSEIPIITDFGIVRDLNASSVTNSWQSRGPCTPFFASPEQLNNEKLLIDWRSDQFSLGITLAFCAFGDHPYKHTEISYDELVNYVANRQNASDEFIKNAEESELVALIKMVNKWPIFRYRTPNSLLDAWVNQRRE